jgi:hypothetical protein
MLLQDLAFPDSGRLLQGSSDPSTTTIRSDQQHDDSGTIVPFNHLSIYVAGVGLVLLSVVCCIRLVRSELAKRDAANAAAAAPVPAQDERAEQEEGGDDEIESALLVQRRLHAILELFRTSQVTMVRNEM